MKAITRKDIMKLEPCYCPSKYISEDWKGTVLDILDFKDAPFKDRLWVICKSELLSDKLLRLFAVWCARQVQHLMEDKRSIDAIDIAERYAHGDASIKELDAARDAAWGADRDAARYAAWYAARDAAWYAARAAATSTAAWDAQEVQLRRMINEMKDEVK